MKDHYFEVKDLANYTKYRYKEKFNREISQITLHKTLYFLFAY